LVVHDAAGTRVEGTMSLHPLVFTPIVVLSAWLLSVAVSASLGLSSGEDSNASLTRSALIVAGLWAFTIRMFTVETRKARRRLEEILEVHG
jgi:hypothetical protein